MGEHIYRRTEGKGGDSWGGREWILCMLVPLGGLCTNPPPGVILCNVV